MKKLFIVLSVLIMASYASNVRAESSSTAYEPDERVQEVYASFYNAGPSDININEPVVLRANATAGSTLGAYIETSASTDNIFVIGVADASIAAGSMGKVCIRGPHKVAAVNNLSSKATGAIFSTSSTTGKAGIYATADGTVGGQLGWLLNTTATTDTGDATNTFWAWINPQLHK